MTEENTEVETAEVEVKAPKARKKVEGVTKDAVVKVLVESNPKRPASKAYERFEKYFELEEGDTVEKAISLGLTMGDIHYDFIAGSIEVSDATVVEYTPQSRAARAEEASNDETSEDTAGEDNSEDASEEGF